MATIDPVGAALTLAAILSIDAKLNSGTTQLKENNREMRFDLSALRDRRAELLSIYAVQTGAVSQVRRVLTFTPTKGL